MRKSFEAIKREAVQEWGVDVYSHLGDICFVKGNSWARMFRNSDKTWTAVTGDDRLRYVSKGRAADWCLDLVLNGPLSGGM